MRRILIVYNSKGVCSKKGGSKPYSILNDFSISLVWHDGQGMQKDLNVVKNWTFVVTHLTILNDFVY